MKNETISGHMTLLRSEADSNETHLNFPFVDREDQQEIREKHVHLRFAGTAGSKYTPAALEEWLDNISPRVEKGNLTVNRIDGSTIYRFMCGVWTKAEQKGDEISDSIPLHPEKVPQIKTWAQYNAVLEAEAKTHAREERLEMAIAAPWQRLYVTDRSAWMVKTDRFKDVLYDRLYHQYLLVSHRVDAKREVIPLTVASSMQYTKELDMKSKSLTADLYKSDYCGIVEKDGAYTFIWLNKAKV